MEENAMKNEVSLCMIVKNEECFLPKCLNSVKDIVDEIIVVDTGSADKTVEIAKSFGAKVYYFKWSNNFSEARNESLKYASKDWILILDADDELYPEDQEKLKDFLNRQLDENTIYHFETLNYYGNTIDENSITINLNPRLFKNNKEIHYEGEVHNQLVHSKDKRNAIYNLVKIHHYGYMNKSIESKNKRNRTITLLKQQIEKDPYNYFAYFNLATEYAALNKLKTALDYYYKSYEDFDPGRGYSFLLILRIVFLNYKLKDFDNALKFIDIGTLHYPKFTDLYFFKALIHRDMNKPTLQIKALERCIELGEAPSELKCFYGTGSFKAYYELGNAYLKLNDTDTAYNYYIKAMKAKSDFICPLYQISFILKNKDTPLDDFKKIIEGFLPDNPRSYLTISDLFLNLGYYETALEYIKRYEEIEIIPEDLILIKARYLAFSGLFEECTAVNNTNEKNPSYLYVSMYKLLSNLLTDNYGNAISLLNSFKEEDLSGLNKKLLKVYTQLIKLFAKEPTEMLSEDENEKEYYAIILEILEIMLRNNKIDKFETAVKLFNLISNKFALLYLGKLYYKYGYLELAKKEIIRSIKEFEVYDVEALDILIYLLNVSYDI